MADSVPSLSVTSFTDVFSCCVIDAAITDPTPKTAARIIAIILLALLALPMRCFFIPLKSRIAVTTRESAMHSTTTSIYLSGSILSVARLNRANPSRIACTRITVTAIGIHFFR